MPSETELNDWIAQPEIFWPSLLREISTWYDIEEHDEEL